MLLWSTVSTIDPYALVKYIRVKMLRRALYFTEVFGTGFSGCNPFCAPGTSSRNSYESISTSSQSYPSELSATQDHIPEAHRKGVLWSGSGVQTLDGGAKKIHSEIIGSLTVSHTRFLMQKLSHGSIKQCILRRLELWPSVLLETRPSRPWPFSLMCSWFMFLMTKSSWLLKSLATVINTSLRPRKVWDLRRRCELTGLSPSQITGCSQKNWAQLWLILPLLEWWVCVICSLASSIWEQQMALFNSRWVSCSEMPNLTW